MAHVNARPSLRTQEDGAVFEVSDTCISWSLDLASDLLWIQAKPRTQLENNSVPGIPEAQQAWIV